MKNGVKSAQFNNGPRHISRKELNNVHSIAKSRVKVHLILL
jgi:hypothetical protein